MHLDPLEHARRLFFEALDHHAAHRWTEAEALYRHALALAPQRVSVLVNLSAVLVSQHRFDEALPYCRQALAIEPQNPDALQHLALCQPRPTAEAALAALDAELVARPDDADLHNNRGALLREQGRQQEALRSFEQALALDPDNLGALSNRASLHVAGGRSADALRDYLHALSLDPSFPPAGQGLVELLRHHAGPPAIPEPVLDSLLARAIRVPWARPQDIAPLLLRRLRAVPALRDAVARVAAAWPRRPAIETCLAGHATEAVFGDDLLIALLTNALVTDVGLERLLTTLRHGLLEEAAVADPGAVADPVSLRFHGALARQCFLNEYIYESDRFEQAALRALGERLDRALTASDPIPAQWVAALASYGPLYALPQASRLMERRWPAPVAALIEQQLQQPRTEQELRLQTPRLTDIRDPVSLQVRRQYEENPYPRWVALPVPSTRESLASYLRRRVPGAAVQPTATLPRIEALVAGCGTGQHPLEMLLRLSGVQMLAIDLSLASLGYAQRMARQLGVRDIEFAQADLLELGSLERRFDLIDSSGVLHHLADPARGLAVLVGLLRDGGLLRLSLYSERARRHVVAARDHVAGLGLGATTDGIRAGRAALVALADEDPRRQVLAIPDFHATSECRDLLFHVQEHRFTLPGVAGLLDEAGLELVGLELDHCQVAAFTAEHPAPGALGDIGLWHAFEQSHPDTFAAMYTVWARRPA
jgi:tetratricopeptide (TPR) repeat protein/SAM-dependent methyltransferase